MRFWVGAAVVVALVRGRVGALRTERVLGGRVSLGVGECGCEGRMCVRVHECVYLCARVMCVCVWCRGMVVGLFMTIVPGTRRHCAGRRRGHPERLQCVCACVRMCVCENQGTPGYHSPGLSGVKGVESEYRVSQKSRTTLHHRHIYTHTMCVCV